MTHCYRCIVIFWGRLNIIRRLVLRQSSDFSRHRPAPRGRLVGLDRIYSLCVGVCDKWTTTAGKRVINACLLCGRGVCIYYYNGIKAAEIIIPPSYVRI